MKSIKKLFDKKHYSCFHDKLSDDELDRFVWMTKEQVNGLWEEEKTAREQGVKESPSTSKKRQENLMQSITALSIAEKKVEGAAAKGFVTGKMEYGEEGNSSMVLTKVTFGTQYGVCSDEVENFSDYKRFWILEDGGEYYHWLKERKNPDDSCEYKPHPIPITFPSTETISFKATFKITSKENFTSKPSIKATDKSGRYLFGIVKGELNDEFQVLFNSTNKPYEHTVRYVPLFEILFEYSQNDGETWYSAGSCITSLYVTWKKPLFSKFGYGSNEKKTMLISNRKNSMNCIVETLLWLGCAYANGLGNKPLCKDEHKRNVRNESAIIDAIFEPFSTLKVLRAREGTKYYAKNDVVAEKGLGYWRGKSATNEPNTDPEFDDLRSLRYLLREGEGRCAEWMELFIHLLLTQGIFAFSNRDLITICTDEAIEKLAYLRDSCTYASKSRDHLLKSIEFSVAGTEFVLNDEDLFAIEGKSAAQGNDYAPGSFTDHVWVYFNRERFYDPSYGLSFSKKDSNLIKYCSKAISSVVIQLADGTYEAEYFDTHRFLYSSVNVDF